MSSDDTPQSLLDQFAPLPAMTDNDSVESPGTLDRTATASLRIKPAPRIATNVDAPAGGSGSADGGNAAGGENGAGSAEVRLAGVPRGLVGKSVPDAYRLRVAPNRSNVAQSRGGTAATEAAVKAALKWLADNQDADGRWNPRTHAAGKETNVLGRDRQHAGSHSDSAMTGLALLAFLASGHTHLDGPYHDDVRRGLEYLMRTQGVDGNLAGEAAPFEFMYCHGMAACALSEAYGMTHDARLSGPVRRAVNYTLRRKTRSAAVGDTSRATPATRARWAGN